MMELPLQYSKAEYAAASSMLLLTKPNHAILQEITNTTSRNQERVADESTLFRSRLSEGQQNQCTFPLQRSRSRRSSLLNHVHIPTLSDEGEAENAFDDEDIQTKIHTLSDEEYHFVEHLRSKIRSSRPCSNPIACVKCRIGTASDDFLVELCSASCHHAFMDKEQELIFNSMNPVMHFPTNKAHELNWFPVATKHDTERVAMPAYPLKLRLPRYKAGHVLLCRDGSKGERTIACYAHMVLMDHHCQPLYIVSPLLPRKSFKMMLGIVNESSDLEDVEISSEKHFEEQLKEFPSTKRAKSLLAPAHSGSNVSDVDSASDIEAEHETDVSIESSTLDPVSAHDSLLQGRQHPPMQFKRDTFEKDDNTHSKTLQSLSSFQGHPIHFHDGYYMDTFLQNDFGLLPKCQYHHLPTSHAMGSGWTVPNATFLSRNDSEVAYTPLSHAYSTITSISQPQAASDAGDVETDTDNDDEHTAAISPQHMDCQESMITPLKAEEDGLTAVKTDKEEQTLQQHHLADQHLTFADSSHQGFADCGEPVNSIERWLTTNAESWLAYYTKLGLKVPRLHTREDIHPETGEHVTIYYLDQKPLPPKPPTRRPKIDNSMTAEMFMSRFRVNGSSSFYDINSMFIEYIRACPVDLIVNANKYIVCPCGEIFENGQAVGGHKGACRTPRLRDREERTVAAYFVDNDYEPFKKHLEFVKETQRLVQHCKKRWPPIRGLIRSRRRMKSRVILQMPQFSPSKSQHSPNTSQSQRSSTQLQQSPKTPQSQLAVPLHSGFVSLYNPKAPSPQMAVSQRSPAVSQHSPTVSQRSLAVSQHSPKTTQAQLSVSPHSPFVSQSNPETSQAQLQHSPAVSHPTRSILQRYPTISPRRLIVPYTGTSKTQIEHMNRTMALSQTLRNEYTTNNGHVPSSSKRSGEQLERSPCFNFDGAGKHLRHCISFGRGTRTNEVTRQDFIDAVRFIIEHNLPFDNYFRLGQNEPQPQAESIVLTGFKLHDPQAAWPVKDDTVRIIYEGRFGMSPELRHCSHYVHYRPHTVVTFDKAKRKGVELSN